MVEINIKEKFEEDLLKRFSEEMEALTVPEIILCNIESAGGYCHILEAMCNIVEKKKAEGFIFVTDVENYAYSCAFIFWLLGDIRFCSDTSELMYHAAGVSFDKNERITAKDAKEIFEGLDYFDQIFDKIALSTGVAPEMFEIIKKNETFFSKKDLIYLGIVKEEYEIEL
jgi:ATP-dependent protease ClpP protease subunit